MEVPVEHEETLHRLVDIFLQENENINLSAFRTQEHCFVGNVLDSLAALHQLKIENGQLKIIDIGTGGGFPLLPLAICSPQCQFVGLDSTKKKLDAIQRIVDALEIRNVQLLTGRAEEKGRDPQHREQYDIVTARAVAPLNTLLEYCSPFVKPGGTIICWKSLNLDQELQDSLLARAELSCQLSEQIQYELPETFGKRQLLIFEKRTPLSEKYPREVGVPKKKPLI